MLKSLTMLFALAVLWLLLSGYFDVPLLLFFGAASCILVTYIAHRMNVVDHESVPLHVGLKIGGYWFWLFREIAKANIAVTKAVFSDLGEIRPQVLTFETGLNSAFGKVILANSITLTPGTVTIELIGDRLTVHALTAATADPDVFIEMDKRISPMEN